MTKKVKLEENLNSDLGKLLQDNKYLLLPKVGDIIKGTVIGASKSEVRLDIGGVKTGIIRGKELYNESDEYGKLKTGEMVEATVVEMENENGEMELSFRFAGAQKAWAELHELEKSGETIAAKVTDANKGGLMVKVKHVIGFLPVSQLIPEHYPRVEGGDKNKILEFLKKFIGTDLHLKVIDVNEEEEKLIVSEKAAHEEEQQKVLSKYKVGDTVKGKVTAITDFGVFVEFDKNMEGLVHISELAWQRIDDPRDVVKVGETVEAQIINIDGTKIFLSMKKLKQDPWEGVEKKYKVGEIVEGKVLKANPFGLFVELDEEIHGLAHISELSTKPINNISEIAKPGDKLKFKIVSIEPKDHRLGLSIKAMKEKTEAKEEKTEKVKEPKEKEEKKEKEAKEEKKEKKEPAKKEEKEAPKKKVKETKKKK